MDASVIRSMTRWPDVPEVRGWLALDRRGRWLLRGRPIRHPRLVAFIGRNYDRDDQGRWFFQNGPQRVYVSLAYTPWIYHFDEGVPVSHTGVHTRDMHRVWLDEATNLLLETELGAGLVRDDQLLEVLPEIVGPTGRAATMAELEGESPLFLLRGKSRMAIERIHSRDLAARLGFVSEP